MTFYLSDPDVEPRIADNAARPEARHLEATNICFADGHVKAVKLDQWITDDANSSDPVWVKWDPQWQN